MAVKENQRDFANRYEVLYNQLFISKKLSYLF